MGLPLAKAKGQRGNWFATIRGEPYPCVHEYWSRGGTYYDPHVSPNEHPWPEFLQAIRLGKKVILTHDKVDPGLHGIPEAFHRSGYVALFRIDNVVIDESSVMFRFVERLVELE